MTYSIACICEGEECHLLFFVDVGEAIPPFCSINCRERAAEPLELAFLLETQQKRPLLLKEQRRLNFLRSWYDRDAFYGL